MAKGQKRSNKEIKKPKQAKVVPVALNPFEKAQSGTDGTAKKK